MREQPPGGQRLTRPGAAAGALLEAAWLMAVLLTPLYFNPRSARVFEPDKLAWVIALALLVWPALLVYGLERPIDWPRLRTALRRPIPLSAGLTGVVLLIGTLLSVVPTVSIWGAYRRGQGILASLAMLSIFAAAATTGGRPETRARFFRLISIVTVPAALYAIMQRFGIDSLQWDIYGGGPSERAFGPLGNPIFLGAWLAMAIPLSLAALASALEAARRGIDGAGTVAAGHGLSIALGLAGIAASQSRGPLLGLAAGLACFAMLAALSRGRRKLALGGLGLTALGVTGLIALGQLGLPGLTRFADLLSPGSRTARSRQLVWEALRQLAEAQPLRNLVGYGPDSLAYVLPRYLSEAVVQLTPDQYFDRAHNLLWESWASAGLLGVLALMLVYLAAFHHGLQRLGLGADDRAKTGRALAIAMLGGAALGWLLALLAGQAALGAAAAQIGLLAGALGLALRLSHPKPLPSGEHPDGKPDRQKASSIPRSQRARAGADPSARLEIDPSWLVIGILAALAAHLVEGAVGLPTASGDTLLWASLGLLATTGSRVAEAGSVRRPSVDGLLEGLALAAVLAAPILLPSVEASLKTWPILMLVPALWLSGDLLAAGRDGGPRSLGRLAVVAVYGLALAALGAIPGGEIFAFALTIGLTLATTALLAVREQSDPRASAAWRWTPYLALIVLSVAGIWWLALRPVTADVLARRGQEKLVTANAAGARADLEKASRRWPQQAIYGALLASAYELSMRSGSSNELERARDFEAARQALERARALAPDDYLAARLGSLYRSRGDQSRRQDAAEWWDRAADYYAESLALNPLNPQTLIEQAGVFERQGRLQEAKDAYALAYRLNESKLAAVAGLMRMALALETPGEADAVLRETLARGIDPVTLGRELQNPAGMPEPGIGFDLTRVMLTARSQALASARQELVALASRAPGDPAVAALDAWLRGIEAP